MTNGSDSGPGSLRQAILDANAAGSENIIEIQLPTNANDITLTTIGGTAFGCTGLPDIANTLTINGHSATIRRDPKSPLFRLFYVPAGSSLSIVDAAIIGGVAKQDLRTCPLAIAENGGGICSIGSLHLKDVSLTGCSAGLGGGIYADGHLVIEDSIVNGNNANLSGGIHFIGVDARLTDSTISANEANVVGGVNFVSGTVTVDRCTIHNNKLIAVETAYGSVTMINSTLSGNQGPAIYHFGPGPLSLIHCTVANNVLSFGQGAIENDYYYPNRVTLSHTILANSVNCYSVNFLSEGFNVDTDGSCSLDQPTDRPNTDSFLGPLADNGGPTMTHALLPGNPAINLIPVDECIVDEDQRGFVRPHGGACDAGAFEFACDSATTCSGRASCKDNDSCFCDRGWSGSDCSKDIDECANGTARCDANATCTNTPGGFTCACDTGSVGDGFTCLPDGDGDGLPTQKDACPNSDLAARLVIDGCDTGLSNRLQVNGCTMTDDVHRCQKAARSHVAFVRCVSSASNAWIRQKLILWSDKTVVVKCASHSSIP
ncbi:MAG: hypothetical protein HY287_04485 [Planctomycetes bacterium]|nr:hypothetical protein [Planctomycetota bacterium]MBI3833571.1 hypothetical protein [Planctomycetota bacterium]